METIIISGNKQDRIRFKRKLDEDNIRYLSVNLLEPFNNFLDMFVEKNSPETFYPLREEIVGAIKNRGLNFIEPIENILNGLREEDLAIIESVDEESRQYLKEYYGAFCIKLVRNESEATLPHDYYMNMNNFEEEFAKLNRVFKFKTYEGVKV